MASRKGRAADTSGLRQGRAAAPRLLNAPPRGEEVWLSVRDLGRIDVYDAKTNIEQELYLIMLEYRQRTIQGAFHTSNDYTHWYGWAPLNANG